MKTIKVVLIGDFIGKGDEGLSQISKRLSKLLDESNIVLNVNTKEIIQLKTLTTILKFKPNIIHYITGPTLRSFIILSFFKIIFLSRVKTVISTTRPFIKQNHFKYLKIFHVDLILTQAEKWESVFKKADISTAFVPNPININKFKQREFTKLGLRQKYEFPIDKKIILHVGHIKENRNLEVLFNVQGKLDEMGFCVILVSSTFLEQDNNLYNKLINSGIIIRREFFLDINELYELADVYLFPVLGLNSNYFPQNYNDVGVIDMPLSILEALSVGVPVLSTHVDAIEVLLSKFEQDPNINFYDGSASDLINILKNMDLNKIVDNSAIMEILDENNIKNKFQNVYQMALIN